jgi:hypothetical protein
MRSQAPGFKDAGPVRPVRFGDFLQQTEHSRRILSIHAMTLEEMVVLGRLPEPKKFRSSDWDSLDAILDIHGFRRTWRLLSYLIYI